MNATDSHDDTIERKDQDCPCPRCVNERMKTLENTTIDEKYDNHLINDQVSECEEQLYITGSNANNEPFWCTFVNTNVTLRVSSVFHPTRTVVGKFKYTKHDNTHITEHLFV